MCSLTDDDDICCSLFHLFHLKFNSHLQTYGQPLPYTLFAHLFQAIHCWFFNSSKNVNLASKVKRNSTGCLVLPLSHAEQQLLKEHKRCVKPGSTSNSEKLHIHILSQKSNPFVLPCLWLLF